MAQANDAQRRADKTSARIRRGGFGPPKHDLREVNIDGMLCDGCGEPIVPTDKFRSVAVGGVFDVRLHDPCYDAWLNFKE